LLDYIERNDRTENELEWLMYAVVANTINYDIP